MSNETTAQRQRRLAAEFTENRASGEVTNSALGGCEAAYVGDNVFIIKDNNNNTYERWTVDADLVYAETGIQRLEKLFELIEKRQECLSINDSQSRPAL